MNSNLLLLNRINRLCLFPEIIIIIIIITSSDDIQPTEPSTLLSNQSPSGLIL